MRNNFLYFKLFIHPQPDNVDLREPVFKIADRFFDLFDLLVVYDRVTGTIVVPGHSPSYRAVLLYRYSDPINDRFYQGTDVTLR